MHLYHSVIYSVACTECASLCLRVFGVLASCIKCTCHKGAIAPRDGMGWPASLPYIRKIHVSVAIGTQAGIRLHKRVPMIKIWGSSKNDQNRTTGKLLKL